MAASAPSDRETPAGPSPRKQRLFRAIMLAGVTLFVALAAVGAEFAARYHERHRTTPPDYFPSIYYPHRRLRYGLIPNLDYYGWFRINSLGFRGREVSVAKSAGVLRIVCLGGSTTFDTGTVGSARPWTEVLEAELRRRLGTEAVEVLNLGIGGATSLDSLIDLQMRALGFQPDLVIVYQGHNDLTYSIPPPRPQRSTLYPLEDRPRSSFMRWLTYHSLLYAKSEERVNERLSGALGVLKRALPFRSDDGVVRNVDAALEHGLSDFRSNLRSIAAIARANRIPLALPQVIVPFPQEGQAGCRICDSLSDTYGGLNVATLRTMFGRYNSTLAELGAEGGGIYYIPTDGFVPSDDRYFRDPVHFGPEGSRRMGVKLAEALAPILVQLRSGR